MPITTPNLGLTKSVQGDTNWGQVLNDNFDLIDAGVTATGVRVVDGVRFTQDSLGIQAAIDEVEAANGGIVFLPAGSYSITSPLTVTMPSNNLGFIMTGAGLATILTPTLAMTVLTVDMGTSNYQSLYLADFAFNLNATSSTALAVNAGQSAVVERLFINNAGGTAAVITTDTDAHDISFNDIRMRLGGKGQDGIVVRADNITINKLYCTGADACVKIPAATSISNTTIQNSDLSLSNFAFEIGDTGGTGASPLKINYLHNRAEGNTSGNISITGFDATTNRVLGLSVNDSYFTGMDTAAEDGIILTKVDGVEIRGNHFRGTGSVAEAVTFGTNVTSVSLSGNTVSAVLAIMTGFAAVPLEVNDVTISQTSVQLASGGKITAASSITTSGGSIGSTDTINPIVFFGGRTAVGGAAIRLQTTNGSGVLATRLELTGQIDTAIVRLIGDLDHDGANVGFFSTTPVAQSPASADLTGSPGTADENVETISGSGADTDINNNFQECLEKINDILLVLRRLGLIAPT